MDFIYVKIISDHYLFNYGGTMSIISGSGTRSRPLLHSAKYCEIASSCVAAVVLYFFVPPSLSTYVNSNAIVLL